MRAVETAKRELDDLGFHPKIVTDPSCSYPPVIMFNYTVTNGSHRGATFRMGISFQENAYPEYPPHFLHVADLPAARLTKHTSYRYQNVEWSVFSFPPNDFWDKLPPEAKNMKTYVYRHLTRVWSQL